MGLQCDEQAGDKYIDGIDDATAVLHAGSEVIEVWDGDAEVRFGSVPASYTAGQINVALSFYRAGEKSGRELGQLDKQIELCRVLGVKFGS